VTVERILPRQLHAVTAKLQEAGVNIEEKDHAVRAWVDQRPTAVDVRTYPYPGFPTDLQQPFGAFLTQAEGEGTIQETMFEDRLRYVHELARMGADVEVRGQVAYFRGPSRLQGAEVEAHDLRAGAAVTLAGLAADGETKVHRGEYVARGYADFDRNLRDLGGDCQVLPGEGEV
jgi:UDP-N-acetylglucosamine 1-carboxyvinyltransferase